MIHIQQRLKLLMKDTNKSNPVYHVSSLIRGFYQQPESELESSFVSVIRRDLTVPGERAGSQFYLSEGNSIAVPKTRHRSRTSPQIIFNRDVQVEYGIERDLALIDCQLRLDYHLGLNNFLQVDAESQDTWRDEYYTHLRRSPHLVPECINTQSNLPQLTCTQLQRAHVLGKWTMSI